MSIYSEQECAGIIEEEGISDLDVCLILKAPLKNKHKLHDLYFSVSKIADVLCSHYLKIHRDLDNQTSMEIETHSVTVLTDTVGYIIIILYSRLLA